MTAAAAGGPIRPPFRLDVRPLLTHGVEPLDDILAAAADIRVGEVLEVVAPFEPVPLYRVLGARGFAHEALMLDGGDWLARFLRER